MLDVIIVVLNDLWLQLCPCWFLLLKQNYDKRTNNRAGTKNKEKENVRFISYFFLPFFSIQRTQFLNPDCYVSCYWVLFAFSRPALLQLAIFLPLETHYICCGLADVNHIHFISVLFFSFSIFPFWYKSGWQMCFPTLDLSPIAHFRRNYNWEWSSIANHAFNIIHIHPRERFLRNKDNIFYTPSPTMKENLAANFWPFQLEVSFCSPHLSCC